MEVLLKKAEQKLRQGNYHPKTAQIYLGCLTRYFEFKRRDFADLDADNIRQFLEEKQEQEMAYATIRLNLNALRFFYGRVLKAQEKIRVSLGERQPRLPTTLSEQELRGAEQTLRNLEQKLMLSLVYGAGVAIDDLILLRVDDLNFSSGLICIRSRQDGGDRITAIPQRIKTSLKRYVKTKKEDRWLFADQQGRQLTKMAVQLILKNALERAGILGRTGLPVERGF